MRLLCDEMLGRLARLIRAAGHDVAMAEAGQPDNELLDRARSEDRILVTRDRRLAEAAGDRGLLLAPADVRAQAEAVGRALALDWMAAPFTRCLMDNAPLRDATPEEVRALLATVQAGPGPFRVCPGCGRRFWPGSHVRRLQERLETLNRSAAFRVQGAA
jgi:hypothetical protein